MKKLIVIPFLVLFSYLAEAQTLNVETGDNAYAQGDKIAQLGVSLGAYGYGGGFFGSRSFALPVNASLEFGFHEFLSAGPYVAFSRWGYKAPTYNYHFSVFAAGARGSFHYLPLINDGLDLGLDESKLDFYITVMLGIEARNWNYGDNFSGTVQSNDARFAFNGVLGFKYKFNQNWGAYFEGGRGAIGYATFGASYTF